MNRQRLSLSFIVASLLITAAGAFSTASAHASILKAPGIKAASATPANSTGNTCLKNASNWCIKSNGTSRQVTLTNNPDDYATFTAFHNVHEGTVDTFQFKNDLGNCLRAGTDNTVKIEDGACNPDDGQDKWYEGTPTSSLINFTQAAPFMGTKGWGPGYKVYTTTDTGDGRLTNWTFPIALASRPPVAARN